jgi:hypothetical protein
MRAHHLFAVVLAIAMVNGVFSPYLVLVVGFAPIWLPTWLPAEPGYLFFLGSLITATTTVLLSGVPAALAEGALGWARGSLAAMWVWVAAAAILALPALPRMVLLAA